MQETPYCLNFERKIIHHCSPTLAAFKPGSLFTCRDESMPNTRGSKPTQVTPEEFQSAFLSGLSSCRERLHPYGVHIEVLARRTTGPLVYVYRPALLLENINQDLVKQFLSKEGYDTSSLSCCIKLLHQRICGTDFQSQLTGKCSFPHEIGFFLGYPYDDVVGFIENQGENFIESGCWKVYSQQRDAQASFCCFKNCTTIYKCLFEDGTTLEELARIDERDPSLRFPQTA